MATRFTSRSDLFHTMDPHIEETFNVYSTDNTLIGKIKFNRSQFSRVNDSNLFICDKRIDVDSTLTIGYTTDTETINVYNVDDKKSQYENVTLQRTLGSYLAHYPNQGMALINDAVDNARNPIKGYTQPNGGKTRRRRKQIKRKTTNRKTSKRNKSKRSTKHRSRK